MFMLKTVSMFMLKMRKSEKYVLNGILVVNSCDMCNGGALSYYLAASSYKSWHTNAHW